MTLRSADLRFAVPHAVEHALVLGTAQSEQAAAMATGLEEAGVLVRRTAPTGGDRPDLVVSPAGGAADALQLPGRAHLVLGRLPTGLRRRRAALPLLMRGAPDAPRLVVPLASRGAFEYYLRMSAPAGRVARAVSRTAAAATRLHLPTHAWVPSAALATLVLAEGEDPRPCIVQAAARVGVRNGDSWLLRLGRGDDLQRAVFTVLEGRRPGWVVKFSRVAGYDRSFVGDAAGLELARTAGGPVSAHAPAHLGQLEVHGLTASVETAAVGIQVAHLLRTRPWPLLDAIARWILDVGRHTTGAGTSLEPERARMRQVVADVGTELGAPTDLVDRVPAVPAVLQHNDLGGWNIISDGQDFTAVDWESARRPGFPMWDLYYFAADVFAKVDGPADVDTRVERTLRVFAGESPHSARLFGWVRQHAAALGVPLEALGPLASLCWLHHGQSPVRRTADLRGAASAPLGHHPRLARAWLEHPGLGASWRALCG